MNRRHWVLLALALPVLGVLGMVVKSELTLARGRELRVPIRGFDPRDLLRGNYLLFQFDLNISGTCEEEQGSCCYCVRAGMSGQAMPAQKGACGVEEGCLAEINAADLEELRRFYVPEEVGFQLEQRVREKRAVAVLAVTPDGKVALKALEIDGKPWREALE